MTHAGHQEQPAGLREPLRSPVRSRQTLVVVDRIVGREPGVADAVVEDLLAAVAVEAGQIGPVVGVDQLLQGVGVLARLVRDEVHGGGQHPAADRPSRRVQQEAGNRARHRHAGVIGMGRIDVATVRGDRASEGRLHRGDLAGAQAAIRLGAGALHAGGIEAAAGHVEHHAIFQAVPLVAGLEERADEKLSVGGGERPAGNDLAGLRVHRRDAVEGDCGPFQRQVRPVGAHGRGPADDAVEQERVALGGLHALAPPGGAPGEVRPGDGPAIIGPDHILARRRHARHGVEAEVEPRLLIVGERVAEASAPVSAIGGDHGEAPRQRRTVTRPDGSQRRGEVPVEAAAAHHQE